MTAGPFERNGVKPRMLDVSRVARREAVVAMIGHLVDQGLLDGVAIRWALTADGDREKWVRAVTEVFAKAEREASKEALAELAGWEELALLLRCRRCGADEEEQCRDLRLNVIKHIKHPHQERMDDMEEQ